MRIAIIVEGGVVQNVIVDDLAEKPMIYLVDHDNAEQGDSPYGELDPECNTEELDLIQAEYEAVGDGE